MTIQDVKDKLAANGATDITDGSPTQYDGRTIHRINYRPPTDEKIDPRKEVVELSDDGIQIKYFKTIPGILREPPTTGPERAFHKPDAEIKTEIEKKYALLKDDSFTVRTRGDDDIVTAQVIDSKDDTIKTAQFLVYDDKGKYEVKEIK